MIAFECNENHYINAIKNTLKWKNSWEIHAACSQPSTRGRKYNLYINKLLTNTQNIDNKKEDTRKLEDLYFLEQKYVEYIQQLTKTNSNNTKY